MNGYNKTALKAYQQAQVNTLDQLSLVSMLYDGAIRFAKQAIIKIEKKDLESAHYLLVRCQDIVGELMCSLNHNSDSPVVKNLFSLYEYIYRQLVAANIAKDTKTIEPLVKMLSDLLAVWHEVDKNRKKADPSQNKKPKAGATSIYG